MVEHLFFIFFYRQGGLTEKGLNLNVLILETDIRDKYLHTKEKSTTYFKNLQSLGLMYPLC